MASLPENKIELRKKILAQRQSLPQKEVEARSRQICESLAKSTYFKKAQNILFYSAIHNEVDLHNLAALALKEHKKVFFPRVEGKDLMIYAVQNLNSDLESGYFKIKEPKTNKDNKSTPEKLDLILVPGVAFDLSGSRLGYGFGYYDRFLNTNINKSCLKMGIGYELQIIPSLPQETHDTCLDLITTEDRIIICKKINKIIIP